MNVQSNITKSYLGLIIALLLIAFTPLLIKQAQSPGVITMFYRMFLGSIGLAPIFIVSKARSKFSISKKGLLIAILAGIALGVDMALWAQGIVIGDAVLPTIVGNTAPLWVGIGASLIFKERLGWKFWVGLAIAFSGILILVLQDIKEPSAITIGVLYGLAAAIFYGIFQLLAQPGRQLLNTISYLFITTSTTAAVLAIIAVINGYNFIGYGIQTVKIWLILGLIIQIGGWYFISFAQGYLRASTVSPILLAQPVITAILSWLVLKDEFTAWHVFSAAIIICGIYIVHFSRKR